MYTQPLKEEVETRKIHSLVSLEKDRKCLETKPLQNHPNLPFFLTCHLLLISRYCKGCIYSNVLENDIHIKQALHLCYLFCNS